ERGYTNPYDNVRNASLKPHSAMMRRREATTGGASWPLQASRLSHPSFGTGTTYRVPRQLALARQRAVSAGSADADVVAQGRWDQGSAELASAPSGAVCRAHLVRVCACRGKVTVRADPPALVRLSRQ